MRWTGVCLDCADAEELAQFYGRLLGWEVTARDGEDWIGMRDPAGGVGLNFQAETWYRPPAWPEQTGTQDKMLHLEIEVDDLEAAIARVVAAGGSTAARQPRDRDPNRLRVMLDPAGHPFCLYVDESTPARAPADASDVAAITTLLGREPRGEFEIVVRDDAGAPLVIRNAPLLDDGTPMPTRYWLVDPALVVRVSRIESAGGVRAAEAAVDPDELTRAHARYASERDAALPEHHAGPRPHGGVAGTARGVKCLHAHYAWHLAGGDDPVGRWVAARLAEEPDA